MAVLCSPTFFIVLGRILDLKALHVSIFFSPANFSSLSNCMFLCLVAFLQFLNFPFYGVRMPTLCQFHLEGLKVVPRSLCSLSSNSLALEESADCTANHGVYSISTENSFHHIKFPRNMLLLLTNSNSHSACL